MSKRPNKDLIYLFLAAAACAQWPLQRFLGVHWPETVVPVFAGLAILGAAFLLSWGAEAAEVDIPSGIAVAVLAIVAVLPEYAVDVFFAWRAGKDPAYASYATANMTGSNRLLIGAGWAAVLLFAYIGKRIKEIKVESSLSTDIFVLSLATLYSFVPAIKGSLSLVDCAVFFALFLFFAFGLGGDHGDNELDGPAALIGNLPKIKRRVALIALLVFAGGGIYLSAEPFAEGLIATGRHYGWNEYLLVQWLAPFASESPEFLVAALFALKGRSGMGLRVLISSKVNQWTLLVGMLPAAFAMSAGSTAPMPLDATQSHELLLTSAQSFFALCVLMDYRFGWKEALALAALFFPQPFFTSFHSRNVFTGLYLVGGVYAFFLHGGFPRMRVIAREALSHVKFLNSGAKH
jgi:cation:H+ antiporter